MPLYDFHCTEKTCIANESGVELLLSRTDLVPVCPYCAGQTLEKKPTQGSVVAVFKGAGWAKDGYASSAASPSPEN